MPSLRRLRPRVHLRLVPCAAALAGVLLLATSPVSSAEEKTPHGGLFRQPDVSATHVVFVYGGDLWVVPRSGGTALPLASPDGEERLPRFSPDGRRVAFVGAYDGGADIYHVPVEGGLPHRVTYHPTEEWMCDWTPGGEILFSARGMEGLPRQFRMYRVKAEGGLPAALPVPYGGLGSVGADGTKLTYCPGGAEHPSWKRYRGGRAPDVWVFDLEEHSSKRLTDWEGTDTHPMWHGGKVYYVSDAGPAHRLNLWVADPATGQRRQITRYRETDVRWPAMGPGARGEGEIVFQEGSGLHLLDLATEKVRSLRIRIPGDRPALRTRTVDVSEQIQGWNISPTGKRAVVSARGDIWTLPAKKGLPRNLTRSPGIAEREPAWSPDGRWIAYFSDQTGEYELWITQSDGKGESRRLTENGDVFRYEPVWSPDSRRVAFTDKAAHLFVHDLESSTTTEVDHDPVVEDEGMGAASWSPDGRWLAYARAGERTRFRSIWIWDANTGRTMQVTSELFDDGEPEFDREGDFLYFRTSRHFSPRYSDQDGTFIYAKTQLLAAAPLRADVKSPFLPESDEESFESGTDDDEAEEDEPADASADEKTPDDGISGTWAGTATSEELLPPGGVTFTLTLRLTEAGGLEGSLSTPMGDATIADGSWDPTTGALALVLTDDGGSTWRIRGQVKGDRVTGEATIVEMGMTAEFEARRTPPAEGPSSGGLKEGESEKKARKEKKRVEPVEIDLDGFEARAFLLPVKPGLFGDLAVNDQGALVYTRSSIPGDDGESSIHMFDPSADKPKEQDVAKGSGWFRMSGDGKHLLVIRNKTADIQKAAAGGGGSPVVTTGMTAVVPPTEEWRQMLHDAWRIMRDYFYDPHMHGLDWPAVLARYEPWIDDCVTADDVGHVIREMIGELNVGHANYWRQRPWRRRPGTVGLLGCDYALEDGAYRIRRIVGGGPWDLDARGPLAAPGLDVREGDYLLAVNGLPMDTSKAPWAAFHGLVGKPTHLTVSEKPVLDDAAREILVKPLSSERDLRYRAWVEERRAYVDEKTKGRVGYVYVPNTGWQGQNELVRQYGGQTHKEALVIDERWNGGGQIPTRFIELLDRPIVNYWARRDGQDWPWPYFGHQGPKCMLMNGASGSGGDAFPWYFRKRGLGKLIGRRTWGGLVGISGNPPLIDGTYMSVPTFAFYEKDGTWGIEGHGVDPDIEVVDDPALMVGGGDPQLDAAIDLMMEEIERRPYRPPARPAYPDRRGMGIPPKDR